MENWQYYYTHCTICVTDIANKWTCTIHTLKSVLYSIIRELLYTFLSHDNISCVSTHSQALCKMTWSNNLIQPLCICTCSIVGVVKKREEKDTEKDTEHTVYQYLLTTTTERMMKNTMIILRHSLHHRQQALGSGNKMRLDDLEGECVREVKNNNSFHYLLLTQNICDLSLSICLHITPKDATQHNIQNTNSALYTCTCTHMYNI